MTECTASGAGHDYTPHGPNGEMQCRYCGAEDGLTLSMDPGKFLINALTGKPQVLVIYGKRGSGKTLLAQALAQLVADKTAVMFSTFVCQKGGEHRVVNDVARSGARVAIIEEPSVSTAKYFRRLIENDKIKVEPKHQDAYMVDNNISWIFGVTT